MKIRHKIITVFILTASLLFTGCFNFSGILSALESNSSEVGEILRNDIFGGESSNDGGTSLQPFANGRTSGETIKGEINEYIENSFFRFAVNESDQKYNVNDYYPDNSEYTHLRVNVTLESTYSDSIPVGVYDFTLVYTYNGEQVEANALEEEFTTGQFPLNQEILTGDAVSGDLYFMVPHGVTEFTLKYVEYYEDEFIGNTYLIQFNSEPEDEAERAAAIAEDFDMEGEGQGEDFTLGNQYTGSLDQTLQTGILSFSVSNPNRYTEVSGAETYDGYDYIEVTIEIKNTTASQIAISTTAFAVTYEVDNSSYYDYSIPQASTISDTIYLEAGETLNAVEYYCVPIQVTEFTINYIDYLTDTLYDSYDVLFSTHTAI